MRILGFSKYWINYLTGKPKLHSDTFSTFRYPRKDRDWQVGEKIQIVMNPRSPRKEWLGVAEIIAKEQRNVGWVKIPGVKDLTFREAMEDGFKRKSEMVGWLYNLYGDKILTVPINKLVIKWVEKGQIF